MKKQLLIFVFLSILPFLLFSKNKNLASSAGTMNLDEINLCQGQITTAPHNGDESLDAGDIIRVVLHDNSGTTLGNITGGQLLIQATISDFIPGITFGTTYYISAIAGMDDGTGNVDLTDPELSVAQGTPIVFLGPLESNELATICQGETFLYWGMAYPLPGTYVVNLISSHGCDSIVYLTVVVAPKPITHISETICEGDFVIIGNNTFVAPGPYSVILVSSQGCDSTVILELTVLNPIAAIFPVSEVINCSGDFVTLSAVIVDPNPNITYHWSGPCVEPSSLPGDPTAEVSCGGEYTLQVEHTENGVTCFSDLFTTTVLTDTIAPVVDAGPDQTIGCNNNSVSLFGTVTPSGSNYAYSWTSAGGFTASSQSVTVTIAGEYCFFAVDINNFCSSITDCVTVIADSTIPNAVTSMNGNIDCNNSSVVISGTGSATGTNITYQWSLDGVVIPGETSLTLTATIPGIYTLEVTDMTSVCSGFSSIVVGDTTPPTVAISTPGTINCVVTSVTLDGSGSSTGVDFNYQWSLDGAIIPGETNSVLLTNNNGTFTLTVTDNSNGCTSLQSVVVIEDVTPPIADAGPDMFLNCANLEIVLDGTASSIGAEFVYQWVTTNGNFLTGGNTLTPVVDIEGIYELLVTNVVNGCSTLDQVVVTGIPGLPIDLGEDTYFDCNLTEMTIVGNSIPTDPNYIYDWTTIDGIIDSGVDTPSPTISSSGTYVLTINDPINGCIAGDEITIIDFDEIVVVDENMNLNCDLQVPNVLEATVQLSNLDLSYLWTTSNGNFISATDILNPTVDAAGTYNLTVTDNANGCTATASIVMGDMLLPTAVIEAIGSSVIDCNNLEIVLDASNSILSTPASYKWSVNGSIITFGVVATGSTPGVYNLVVTDANGCSDSESFVVGIDTNLPDFTLPSEVLLNCNNNFTEEVGPVLSSSDQNVSYEWFDASGTSISTDSSFVFSQNMEGVFELLVTDLDNGCGSTSLVEVTFDGFDIAITTTSAGCDLEDGTATATSVLSNSLVEWSNGGLGNTITGLAQGWYSVTLTDTDNNCSRHENFFVDEDISCKVVISGYVLEDPNNTCTYDANLEGIECVMIKLNPLGIYSMTDSTGYYEFVVEDGSYTVEYIGSPEVDLECPSPGTYDVTLDTNGSISGDNHFFVTRPNQDLCITKNIGNARPGFNQFNCVRICNYGELEADAVVTFMHDTLFSNQTPWPNIFPAYNNTIASTYSYDAATNTFTWNLDDLEPGECRKIMWWMPVPLTANLGDMIHSEAKVNPITGDSYPDNNCLAWDLEITGSYDPNDKRNFVGESQWGGAIYEDDVTMEYAIRFQNVGTDTAFTVVVRDTLDDEHLDVTTIRGFTASHDMQVQFEDSNVLIFTFNNIMLVDSATNEPASNGWLNFDIDRKPNQSFGTEITNSAAIYFDYNDPVITNELVNVLTNPVSVFSPNKNTLEVEIIPTVTDDEIRVHYVMEKTNSVSIQVYNVGGVLLYDINIGKKQTGEHVENISLKYFTAGVYFVFVKTEEGSAVQKIVKM